MLLVFLEVFQNIDVDDQVEVLTVQDHLNMFEEI